MTETTVTVVDLSRRVHDMIAQYVNRRTERRSGIKWDEFKDRRVTDPSTGRTRLDVPTQYREAREKVCMDAFLAMRACHSREDFVAYFTGTICAEPQYLPMADYQELAEALLGGDDRWEQVKALSMLALSALQRV
jgi:CRISPR-associated protein Cmx8